MIHGLKQFGRLLKISAILARYRLDEFLEATHLYRPMTLLRILAPFVGVIFIALVAAFLVWVLLWRTRLGYQIRAFGQSEPAARYAGIDPFRTIMITMLISGGLAGLMAINNVMGEAERLVLNAVEGAGFIGIAVALMGRSHPFGIFLAAILFGFQLFVLRKPIPHLGR